MGVCARARISALSPSGPRVLAATVSQREYAGGGKVRRGAKTSFLCETKIENYWKLTRQQPRFVLHQKLQFDSVILRARAFIVIAYWRAPRRYAALSPNSAAKIRQKKKEKKSRKNRICTLLRDEKKN